MRARERQGAGEKVMPARQQRKRAPAAAAAREVAGGGGTEPKGQHVLQTSDAGAFIVSIDALF